MARRNSRVLGGPRPYRLNRGLRRSPTRASGEHRATRRPNNTHRPPLQHPPGQLHPRQKSAPAFARAPSPEHRAVPGPAREPTPALLSIHRFIGNVIRHAWAPTRARRNHSPPAIVHGVYLSGPHDVPRTTSIPASAAWGNPCARRCHCAVIANTPSSTTFTANHPRRDRPHLRLYTNSTS